MAQRVSSKRKRVVGPRPHTVPTNEQYRKLIKGTMRCHLAGPPALPVHISPITHFDYQNAKHDVLNIAGDPIVPDAVAPVSTELWAG